MLWSSSGPPSLRKTSTPRRSRLCWVAPSSFATEPIPAAVISAALRGEPDARLQLDAMVKRGIRQAMCRVVAEGVAYPLADVAVYDTALPHEVDRGEDALSAVLAAYRESAREVLLDHPATLPNVTTAPRRVPWAGQADQGDETGWRIVDLDPTDGTVVEQLIGVVAENWVRHNAGLAVNASSGQSLSWDECLTYADPEHSAFARRLRERWDSPGVVCSVIVAPSGMVLGGIEIDARTDVPELVTLAVREGLESNGLAGALLREARVAAGVTDRPLVIYATTGGESIDVFQRLGARRVGAFPVWQSPSADTISIRLPQTVLVLPPDREAADAAAASMIGFPEGRQAMVRDVSFPNVSGVPGSGEEARMAAVALDLLRVGLEASGLTDAEIAEALAQAYPSSSGAAAVSPQLLEDIATMTRRQQQFLALSGPGVSDAEVSRVLGVSRERVLQLKRSVAKRLEALRQARQRPPLDPQQVLTLSSLPEAELSRWRAVGLTLREQQVTALRQVGLNFAEIGGLVGVTDETARQDFYAAERKLGEHAFHSPEELGFLSWYQQWMHLPAGSRQSIRQHRDMHGYDDDQLRWWLAGAGFDPVVLDSDEIDGGFPDPVSPEIATEGRWLAAVRGYLLATPEQMDDLLDAATGTWQAAEPDEHEEHDEIPLATNVLRALFRRVPEARGYFVACVQRFRPELGHARYPEGYDTGNGGIGGYLRQRRETADVPLPSIAERADRSVRNVEKYEAGTLRVLPHVVEAYLDLLPADEVTYDEIAECAQLPRKNPIFPSLFAARSFDEYNRFYKRVNNIPVRARGIDRRKHPSWAAMRQIHSRTLHQAGPRSAVERAWGYGRDPSTSGRDEGPPAQSRLALEEWLRQKQDDVVRDAATVWYAPRGVVGTPAPDLLGPLLPEDVTVDNRLCGLNELLYAHARLADTIAGSPIELPREDVAGDQVSHADPFIAFQEWLLSGFDPRSVPGLDERYGPGPYDGDVIAMIAVQAFGDRELAQRAHTDWVPVTDVGDTTRSLLDGETGLALLAVERDDRRAGKTRDEFAVDTHLLTVTTERDAATGELELLVHELVPTGLVDERGRPTMQSMEYRGEIAQRRLDQLSRGRVVHALLYNDDGTPQHPIGRDTNPTPRRGPRSRIGQRHDPTEQPGGHDVDIVAAAAERRQDGSDTQGRSPGTVGGGAGDEPRRRCWRSTGAACVPDVVCERCGR